MQPWKEEHAHACRGRGQVSTEMLREGIERGEEIFKMNLKAALKKVGKKEDRNKVL